MGARMGPKQERPTLSFRSELDRRRFLQGGLLAGAGLVLAACSSGSSSSASPSASNISATVPSTKPDKLIVRSWADPWSTTIGDIPGKAFTQETGIPIQFDLSDIGAIATKVQKAIAAGQRPPVDVVYTIAPFAYTAGVQQLAIELDPAIVTNLNKLTAAGKPEGGNFYTNIYTYTIPVIFNTAKTSFATGASIGSLADSKYKKTLMVAPNFSPLLYPYAKMLNIELTADLLPVWDAIAKLRPNISAVGDDTVLIDSFKSGEATIGIGGLIGDVPALKTDGIKADYAVAAEGSTLTADSMFVPKGLPDDVTYYSQVFVNKVIDAQLQSAWCAKVQTVPVNSEAVPAPSMAGQPGFPFTDAEIAKYAIIEPIGLAAQNNDAWQAAYTNAIQATGGG